MFIWDFVADKILGQIVDWFYSQVVGFLGNFFSEMGSMGAGLFEMNWVQSVVLFFSYLGWALFATGLVVAVFECGIEYSAGRGNVKETALNVLKGFLAVSLFTQVPVRLYSLAISLQGTLTAGITGFGSTSIGDAAKAALADLENLESLTESTYPLRGFGRETSGLMVLFCLILMAYAVIKVFFANLKRGGILLIQIAVGSLYVQTGKIVWKRVRPDPKISLAPYYHELLRRFCQHEANTRAIGFESLRDEENVCRKFFAYLDASGCHTCQDINLVNVNAFLLFIASQRKSSMDRVCNTLKHLSAYLVSIQNCCDFSAALTTRPAPRKKLRPAFSAKEVHTVVDAAAKNPSLSLRDTAMFAVAASLGLRAGDIVRLTLSDIDWIHHEIRFVQNKTGVELHLPLEASVGNAIANYILHERSKTQSPALFVRSRIPFDFMTSTAAGDRLRKYMKLSDVEYTPGDGKGFHSFRRYVASSMINQEVPIDTVKEILGHTQIGSMKAYMRISRDKLAMCALGLDGIEVVQEALL